MFLTSFRTSQVRCQVQKFIMKFTNRFVNKVSDWLLNQTRQSNAQFTNPFVNFIMNFWTWQRICEVRNEVPNIWVKSKLKSTVKCICFLYEMSKFALFLITFKLASVCFCWLTKQILNLIFRNFFNQIVMQILIKYFQLNHIASI
jgi:hypothetical protein